MPPPPPKAAGKAAKRQHYLRLQAKRRRKESARGMQKLATQHARLLLRALKTAKNMELAKASRRIKSVAEDGGAGKGGGDLAARREAIKGIAIPELLAAAVETHHLELLVEHSPKQFETPTASTPAGEPDEAAKQTAFFREQATRKIIGVGGVTKVVEEFQRGTLALIAAEEADRSKGAKRKRPPPGSGANSIAVGSGAGSSQPVSQFVGSLNSGATGGYSSGEEDAELFEAMARRDGTTKNRRGQKARQKIAEKKHGQRAKHIVKAQKKEVELAAKRAEARAAADAAAAAGVGSSARAGAAGASDAPPEENRKQKRARLRAEGKLSVRIGTDGGGDNDVGAVIARAAANADVEGDTERPQKRQKKKKKNKQEEDGAGKTAVAAAAAASEEEKLHPSWAAKRQAKPAVPAGTRITFD
jgi:hypothetical protein